MNNILLKNIKHPHKILFIVVCAITFLIYYTNLSNQFLYELDDEWLIINNEALRNFSFEGIKYFFLHDYRDLSYQPLMYLSLSIDLYIFGLNPFLIKIHSLIIHLLTGILVYKFIFKITKDSNQALFVSTIFLIHPIQVENIAWTTCRRQVLFGFYYFLSLLIYTKYQETGRKKIILPIFLTSILLAFSSKFTAIIILPSIVFTGYIFYNKDRKNLFEYIINNKYTIITFCIISYIFYLKNQEAIIKNPINIIQKFDYTTLEYILISIKSFGFYFYKFLIPRNLSVYYPEPMPGHIFENYTFYLYIIFFIALIILLIKHYLKTEQIIFFSLLVSFCCIIPVSIRLIAFSDLTWNNGDRYIYTTIPFMALYVLQFLNHIKFKNIILGLYIMTLPILTSNQIKKWKDSKTIFNYVLENFPNSEFYRKLAIVYVLEDNLSSAYKNMIKSENCENQNYINVPSWTYLNTAYIFVKNNDTSRAKNELYKAYLKDGKIIDKYKTTDSILMNSKNLKDLMIKYSEIK